MADDLHAVKIGQTPAVEGFRECFPQDVGRTVEVGIFLKDMRHISFQEALLLRTTGFFRQIQLESLMDLTVPTMMSGRCRFMLRGTL